MAETETTSTAEGEPGNGARARPVTMTTVITLESGSGQSQEPFFSTAPLPVEERELYPCGFCGLSCHSKSGLARHLPKCRKNPGSTRYEKLLSGDKSQHFLSTEVLDSSRRKESTGEREEGQRRFAGFLMPDWTESVLRSLKAQPTLAKRIARGSLKGFKVVDSGYDAYITTREGMSVIPRIEGEDTTESDDVSNDKVESGPRHFQQSGDVRIRSSHFVRPEALSGLPVAELPEEFLYPDAEVACVQIADKDEKDDLEVTIRARDQPFPTFKTVNRWIADMATGKRQDVERRPQEEKAMLTSETASASQGGDNEVEASLARPRKRCRTENSEDKRAKKALEVYLFRNKTGETGKPKTLDKIAKEFEIPDGKLWWMLQKWRRKTNEFQPSVGAKVIIQANGPPAHIGKIGFVEEKPQNRNVWYRVRVAGGVTVALRRSAMQVIQPPLI